MKIIAHFMVLFLMFMIAKPENHEPVYKFEGVLGNVCDVIENQNGLAPGFLPYNPTMIEIGSYKGAGTLMLASGYPYGKIFCFEPNPGPFAVLQENVKSCKNVFPVNLAVNHITGHAPLYFYPEKNNDNKKLEHVSSLLPGVGDTTQSSITVPCVTLDDWCQSNHIDRVDFLRVDAGGLELRILENSPNVLKKVIIIIVKTYFKQLRENGVLYPEIKQFLEKNDFEMLAHWYCEGSHGEATFVRKAYYDSIFR